ncbi:unnamed protein product, partial [Effrenium voratum]
MNIKVLDVEELPANTFLSMRYGEVRKQAPFRAGETFSFPSGTKEPKAFTVDVLRKVASAQISLAGISAMGACVKNVEIDSLDISNAPMKVSFEASTRASDSEEKGLSRGKSAAERAKQYMEQSGIQPFLQEMFAELLERKPEDYLGFLADFIDQKRDEADQMEGIDFSFEPGLGDEALPGFESFPLPDLSKHTSIATEVLRSSTLREAIPELATQSTSKDVTLARCVKAAVDCPGHPLVKVAGAFAGDVESYDTFRAFFDPLVAKMHPGWPVQGANWPHPVDQDVSKIADTSVDYMGVYVVYSSLEARRNIEGLRFPMCCLQEERREVEKILCSACTSSVGSSLRGSYLPLRGSQSCPLRPHGMAAYQEERLRKMSMLLTEPDSTLKLAAGFGRHWPDARGVFVADTPGVCVWCNEEDHFRFFARSEGCDLRQLYVRLAKAMRGVEEAVTRKGHRLARSERLGWITSCPSKLGAALRLTVTLRIPKLAKALDLPALCQSLQLVCDASTSAISGNLWQLHSADSLGLSEVDFMKSMVQACQLLVSLEQRLEKNQSIFPVLPGIGFEYPSRFPRGSCPKEMPDLSSCSSLVAACLRAEPELYTNFCQLSTSRNTGLGDCLRPGFDPEVGKHRTQTGLVAGDEECVDTFKDIFLAVHRQLQPQPFELPSQYQRLDTVQLPCKWVKIEMRRNISGIRFAPCTSSAERREVERLLLRSLQAAPSSGKYLPLPLSTSYPLMPNGTDPQEEQRLVQLGKLFTFPRTPAELSAGVGREWPDARGAFVMDSEDAAGETVLWINQADHLRLR